MPLDGCDKTPVVGAKYGAEAGRPGVAANHQLGKRQKVVVHVAFPWIGDVSSLAIRALYEPYAAAERHERAEVVAGAIQVGLKAHTDIRQIRKHAAVDRQRRIDVRVLLHINPDEGAVRLRACHERMQIRIAALRVDVEAELGQLDRYVTIQSACVNPDQRIHVVTGDDIGSGCIGDVFTEFCKYSADPVLTQCGRGPEGVSERLARHEPRNRLPDERQVRRVTAQPRALGTSEQEASHQTHSVRDEEFSSPADLISGKISRAWLLNRTEPMAPPDVTAYLQSLHPHAARQLNLQERMASTLKVLRYDNEASRRSTAVALNRIRAEFDRLAVTVTSVPAPARLAPSRAAHVKAIQQLSLTAGEVAEALRDVPKARGARLERARVHARHAEDAARASAGSIQAALGVAAATVASIPIIGSIIAAILMIIAAILVVIANMMKKNQEEQAAEKEDEAGRKKRDRP
jgi:hypothetical protein